MRTKIIALANQKGGVAKTTSTYNLATAKALEGYKVLMVDLDAQASLTIAAGITPGDPKFEGRSSADLFDKKCDPVDSVFKVEGLGLDDKLYIIPSILDLALVDNYINALDEKVYFLKDACDILDEYDFDYIFLDCPPNLGIIVTNALVAATDVIIPVKTDYLSYCGLQLISGSIEKIKSNKRMNPDLNILGVLATLFRSTVNDNKTMLNILNKQWSDRVLGVIKESAEIEKGVVNAFPVVINNPNCDAAKAYLEVAKRI